MSQTIISEPMLKLAIHGVPDQSARVMRLFIQQISKEISIINNTDEADIHLIDMDYSDSERILTNLMHHRHRSVIIITSLTEKKPDANMVFLKKPLTKEATRAAIKLSQTQLLKLKTNASHSTSENQPSAEQNTSIEQIKKPTPAKQKPTKQLNETLFSNFIGVLPEIDANDPKQIANATFSPKDYFLCYVYNAIKTAHQKGLVLEINTGWKPLVIFPHSREIWLDATDHQLRAFAHLKINASSKNNIKLSTVNIKDLPPDKQDGQFQPEESLLWKLALWTSKGRYSSNIDPDKPIVLKHWPNLTRLTLTPHALRICALLIKQPQSMLDVAKTLNIGPQYVFTFITACSALNLVSQVDKAPTRKKIAHKKNRSLLSKILSKLRTKTDNDSA
jgi:hypothetical protein